MDLYVIRHADALPLGEGGIVTEEERPLSELGHVQAKALAARLRLLGIRLDRVVTSPLVRAQQTAEALVLGAASPAPTLHVCNHLEPGGRLKKVLRYLGEIGGDAVAIVGHQPDLGEHLARLIGAKDATFDLEKASVAYLKCPEEEVEKGACLLLWLVTPEWFLSD